MIKNLKKFALYLIAVLGIGGIIFNLFQIIVIISGGYNRNPEIDSPILQILDSIALTALSLALSLAVSIMVIRMIKQSN